MCVCERERERERERESSFCAEYYSYQRKEEHPKTSGGFSLLFRLFFCLLLSVEEKERDLYRGLGFIFLIHKKSSQIKKERERQRERERDFARETERER